MLLTTSLLNHKIQVQMMLNFLAVDLNHGTKITLIGTDKFNVKLEKTKLD